MSDREADRVGAAGALWAAYLAAHPELQGRATPVVEQFGDHARLQDELLGLVLDGTKRATAGLVAPSGSPGAVPPAPDDHWIVADTRGRPVVVLRPVETRVGVLATVDDAFARDEGEDDRSRASWLREHRRYFSRVLPPGQRDLQEQPVLFGRVAVVWPPARVTAADREGLAGLRRRLAGEPGRGRGPAELAPAVRCRRSEPRGRR